MPGFCSKISQGSKKQKKPTLFFLKITGLQEDSLLGSQGLKLIILGLCARQSGCVVYLVIKDLMIVVLQDFKEAILTV